MEASLAAQGGALEEARADASRAEAALEVARQKAVAGQAHGNELGALRSQMAGVEDANARLEAAAAEAGRQRDALAMEADGLRGQLAEVAGMQSGLQQELTQAKAANAQLTQRMEGMGADMQTLRAASDTHAALQ